MVPGLLGQRKRSTEGNLQDHPLAKRTFRCALTGSEGTAQTMSVTSSSLVQSIPAIERSPPIYEGELCLESSPSWS